MDYPDFIELNKTKIVKLNDGTNIKDIKLYNFGNNKRYINPYIKPPHEYIKSWNKLAEDDYHRDCVRFLLRTQFYKLVERHLISEKILGDDHLDYCFKTGYTINNIINFVKYELNNYGSIYIYDPTGLVLIDKYIGYKQEALATIDGNINNTNISRRYCKTVIGIINGDHIDPITEPNVSNSISHGMPLLNIFSTPLKNETMTFELFDNPEKLACCDESYIEYDENGKEKNKNADIILFEETDTTYSDFDNSIIKYDDGRMEIILKMPPCKDVKELYYKTSKYHNVVITNPIFDGKDLIGFKHPITNQQFIKTSDFYERKKVCNKMYDEKGFEELVFKNQSWFQISILYFEYYDFGLFKGILSHHSETQRMLYIQHPISQCIGRHDDDQHLEDRHKKCGTNNKSTFDIVKSYSSVFLHSNECWIVPTSYDVFVEFDINNPKHTEIPYGEYILHSGSYGDERTKIKFNVNYYTFRSIRKLLKHGYIKFSDIKEIRIIKKVLPHNYFQNFVKTAYDNFGKIGKNIINTFAGGLHQITYKRRHGTYTDNQEVAVALTNLYTEHGFKAHLEPDLYDELYFISVMTETPNYHTGTAIWRQIQEEGIWQLHNMIKITLYKTPKAEVIAYNTDSATILNPNQDYLKKAIEDTQYKNNFNMIGEVKIEDTINHKMWNDKRKHVVKIEQTSKTAEKCSRKKKRIS